MQVSSFIHLTQKFTGGVRFSFIESCLLSTIDPVVSDGKSFDNIIWKTLQYVNMHVSNNGIFWKNRIKIYHSSSA